MEAKKLKMAMNFTVVWATAASSFFCFEKFLRSIGDGNFLTAAIFLLLGLFNFACCMWSYTEDVKHGDDNI